MSKHQSSSDPLPYVQVDRAVKPKAALLAGAMGVTVQHALGSLVEWWDLCGDPRELEAVVRATPPGQEPRVILDACAVSTRFELASGQAVAPAKLASLGLLEALEDGRFRVRGMSRFLAPIHSRLRARTVASAGGKASAEARKERYGSANPRSQLGSAAGSPVGSQTGTEREPTREPTREPACEPTREANVNPSGQRSAVSGHLLEEEGPPPVQPRRVPLPAQHADRFASGPAYFAWIQQERLEAGFPVEKPPRGLDAWFSEIMMELNADHARIDATVRAFAFDAYWRERSAPFAALVKEWRKYVPRKAAS